MVSTSIHLAEGMSSGGAAVIASVLAPWAPLALCLPVLRAWREAHGGSRAPSRALCALVGGGRVRRAATAILAFGALSALTWGCVYALFFLLYDVLEL